MTLPRQTSAIAVAQFLGAELHGPDVIVADVDAFPPRRPHILCFTNRVPAGVDAPACSILVLTPSSQITIALACGYSAIASEYPKYDFARVFDKLMRIRPPPGIHPSAIIHAGAKIGRDVIIGPHCLVDENVVIEDGAWIGSRVNLSNQVLVGGGTRIRNGAVLGEDAYSHGFGPDYHSLRVPSHGSLLIGRNVEIGNNVVISRGVFEDTVLSEEVRINDLAHIGNSTRIAARTMIQAHCDISSRCRIGQRCWISQSVAIHQGLTIGDDCLVGMGAVVVSDIPSGSKTMGVPARIVGPRNPGLS